jgi:hypothetical protein
MQTIQKSTTDGKEHDPTTAALAVVADAVVVALATMPPRTTTTTKTKTKKKKKTKTKTAELVEAGWGRPIRTC